jgi:multisubunit Na+/H+ antiporter MnhE subunit
MKKAIKILSVLIAIIIFILWMSLVGNPHVVETVIGLLIATTSGFLINRKLSKFFIKK